MSAGGPPPLPVSPEAAAHRYVSLILLSLYVYRSYDRINAGRVCSFGYPGGSPARLCVVSHRRGSGL
ncbi:hypothetical protein FA95DRAFT_1554650 [Auriscalpium vulgare]|uniref:Uncharacterized protein n=1 Tax=Auriscalpium vulgare TaxID=40419 RepID=A0ACB8S576_9AGAM|nr:hypothetical protein FA95DRAFT_1554650 [Auriscalpium vulgare]